MKNTPVRQTPEKHKIDKVISEYLIDTSYHIFFFVDSFNNYKYVLQ